MPLRDARKFARRALTIGRASVWSRGRKTTSPDVPIVTAPVRGAQLVFALVLAGVAGASFASALAIASRLAQTSDSARGLVEGYAIAQGNVLLSGWLLPLDNYYFTDTLPYAALELFLGPQPILLALIPAVAYTLFVCAGLALCLSSRESIARNVESAAAAVLMLAPSAWIGGWNPLLMSDMHFATVLAALVALALCVRIARPEQQGLWLTVRCGAFVAITSATVASDPFSLVFAFGPAAAVLSADALLHGPDRNGRDALIALAVAAMAGALLPALISRAGGFATENHIVTTFVAPGLLGRNASALGAGILKLSGLNPHSAVFSFGGIIVTGLRMLVLVVAVGAVLLAARELLACDRAALFDGCLCAGILTLLAACLLSAQFGKGIDMRDPWVGGPPMRYAMPAVMFAAILGARRISAAFPALREHPVRVCARGVLVVLATLALAAGVLEVPSDQPPPWISRNPAATAVRWLEAHGLTAGDADYWSANLMAAMSEEGLKLRSVVPQDGRVVPYALGSGARRRDASPQFIVWQDGTRSGMTFADVRSTYSVCRVELVAGYRIALLAGTGVEHACRRSKA